MEKWQEKALRSVPFIFQLIFMHASPMYVGNVNDLGYVAVQIVSGSWSYFSGSADYCVVVLIVPELSLAQGHDQQWHITGIKGKPGRFVSKGN